MSYAYWEEYIKRKTPTIAEILLENPLSVCDLMRHEDESVKISAIIAGFGIWNFDDCHEYLINCKQLVAGNSSDDVKHVVVVALTRMYYGSRRRDVQKTLWELYQNTKATTFLRNCAYRAILEIEHGFIDVHTSPHAQAAHEFIKEATGEAIDLITCDEAFISSIGLS